MTRDLKTAADIAKMLSDPGRLQMLLYLSWGPCSVAQIVEATGASQPNVSNHLKRLRDSGLVEMRKSGRMVFYAIASSEIAEVVSTLCWAATGSRSAGVIAPPQPLREARTCYDHLAGNVGVRILRGLIATDALTEPKCAWDDIHLGPRADPVFAHLKIDISDPTHLESGRRAAFACPDWNDGDHFHLGGHLGARLLDHFFDQGWLRREEGREVSITDAGRNKLGWLLAAADTRPPATVGFDGTT